MNAGTPSPQPSDLDLYTRSARVVECIEYFQSHEFLEKIVIIDDSSLFSLCLLLCSYMVIIVCQGSFDMIMCICLYTEQPMNRLDGLCVLAMVLPRASGILWIIADYLETSQIFSQKLHRFFKIFFSYFDR